MLGDKIAAMRKRSGLSQRELARLLNIKQNTMSQYERGIRKIPFDTLMNIAKILKCSILDLACEELGASGYELENFSQECSRVSSALLQDVQVCCDPQDAEVLSLLKDLDQIAKSKVIDFMRDQKVVTNYYKAVKERQ